MKKQRFYCRCVVPIDQSVGRSDKICFATFLAIKLFISIIKPVIVKASFDCESYTMARKYLPKNKFPKLSADQRCAIALLKSQKATFVLNITDSEIARQFNCDPKTVRNTYKKWIETRKVTSVKQPGRKRILSDVDRDDLKRACEQHPFKTARALRDSRQLNLKHENRPYPRSAEATSQGCTSQVC